MFENSRKLPIRKFGHWPSFKRLVFSYTSSWANTAQPDLMTSTEPLINAPLAGVR